MNEEMITRIATVVAVAVANEIGNITPVSSVGTEEVATTPKKAQTPRKSKTARGLTEAQKAEKKQANKTAWKSLCGHVNYAKSIVETDPAKALESLRKATSIVDDRGWSMPKNIEATYALLTR